ncbi:hypothetical protein ACLB2K_049233 [Fragaria x ananassa]
MFSTERNLVVSRAIQCELPSDVVLLETEIRRGDEIILMVPHQIKVIQAIRTRQPLLVWCCNRHPEGATLGTTWLDTLPAWASLTAMPLAGIMADLLGSVSTSQVDIDSDTWESMLDHSDADQQMVVADDQLRVITRLWCSHLYHRACIVGWLEKSHSVPCANIL